jgi:hypothetical protein
VSDSSTSFAAIGLTLAALATGPLGLAVAQPPAVQCLVEVSRLARKGRFDYLLVESTGVSEPLPAAEPRLGRRTVLTFPLLPPPQKN